MEGRHTYLYQFMEGSKESFVIPVYQRNYDWKKTNCEQLFNDLVKLVRTGRDNHFFGSIVNVVKNSVDGNEHVIIDGQQRLTTVSLLLMAICRLLREGKLKAQDSTILDQITNEYLQNKYKPENKKIRLKLVKNDNEAFRNLFSDDEKDYISDSNLTINFHYFYERIQKQEISVDELYMAFQKLMIINITLDYEKDDPQLVFESLNSTGLKLEESDKIRNYILMGLDSATQEKFYNAYWNKIEDSTDSKVSDFIRDYLTTKLSFIPNKNEIYFCFKNYVEERKEEGDNKIEVLLKELLHYSQKYKVLLGADFGDKVINGCIKRLNRIKVTVARPFLLDVLCSHDNGDIRLEDVRTIFQIVETYVLRRRICNLPTNALNKSFMALHRETLRLSENGKNSYLDVLKYILLHKKGNFRFPDDEEFKRKFEEQDIYFMKEYKTYIFERFENRDIADDIDVYQHVDAGEYTVEHIMPQTLNQVWKERLGSNWEDGHRIWLHKLGNLTLIAHNSELGNKPFEEKKPYYEKSHFHLNANLVKLSDWNFEQIEKRGNDLINEALKVWTLPITNFVPKGKEIQTYSLDDEDVDFTGTKPEEFVFKGMAKKVSSWVNLFDTILKVLFEENPHIISQITSEQEKDEFMKYFFKKKRTDLQKPFELSNGIYVETQTNTIYKLKCLRELFDRYGIDWEELVFTLRSDDEQ